MAEKLSTIQKALSGHGMYLVYALLIAIIIAQIGLLMLLPKPTTQGASDQVTLVGVPWDQTIPMFERLSEVEAPHLEQFVDGTICTKLSGSTTADMHGNPMNFYLLECNGTTGYVYASRVRE